MNSENARLGNSSAAFGLAAAITALFNTALACVKDAYHPLNSFMNSIAGHNWTTQALADIILFAGLGLTFSATHLAVKVKSSTLIQLLTGAAVIAGAGLFAWYFFY